MTTPGECVLVVEDEAPMRRFLCQALVSHGYRVAEAGSLAKAERGRDRDAGPPRSCSISACPTAMASICCARVREWSNAPVIVLSARDREGRQGHRARRRRR